MSKAEEFIIDYTRNCSNELCAVEDRFGKKVVSYHEWLTPDQARTAVEIAREETIEEACDVIRHKYGHYNHLKGDIIEELIREFRKAMKNE